MKTLVVCVHRIVSACAAGSTNRPKESITSSLQRSDWAARRERSAIPFCGGQKVPTRRDWQTEAHPRYGVTRGEGLGFEAVRVGAVPGLGHSY